MTLKLIGCILITLSSTTFGLNYIKNIKTRVFALNEIMELINTMKIKISYEFCDIPNLLHSLSGKYLIARQCHMHLIDCETLQVAWNKSIDEYASVMHLKAEDVRILRDLCMSLGQTDIDGQISNLNMYSNIIEENYKKANLELNSKSRVIFSTSMFAGLLISIILI